MNGKRRVDGHDARTFDIAVRTPPHPGDVIVVAVLETSGIQPFRRDHASVEKDVRGAVLR